jgi:Trk K+ transport system NAD-binding subunit
LRDLKNREFPGRVALRAANPAEAEAFKKAGADLVFQPFRDAAEQAIDALTDMIDFLPEHLDWPISFLEVRIPTDASVAGNTIGEIALRATTGTSILAVSRAGRVFYEPGPEFRVYPSDRMLIMGPPKELRVAEKILSRMAIKTEAAPNDRFEIAEIGLRQDSPLAYQTPAALRFRQTYGVTIIGIRRGQDQITSIRPETERLVPGDGLIVIGAGPAVESLKIKSPL